MGSSPIALTKYTAIPVISDVIRVTAFASVSVSTPCQQTSQQAMPRDGATIFSDLICKLDVLRVSCSKCERDGCYGLGRLIEKRGRDAKVIDWPDLALRPLRAIHRHPTIIFESLSRPFSVLIWKPRKTALFGGCRANPNELADNIWLEISGFTKKNTVIN